MNWPSMVSAQARSATIAVLVGRENDVVEGHTAVHTDAEAALAVAW